MITLVAMLACGGHGGGPKHTREPDPVDTGGSSYVELPPPCQLAPCVSDLAVASWAGEVDAQRVGYAVAARDDLVLVGGPYGSPYGNGRAFATLLGLDLRPLRQWDGATNTNNTGISTAVGPGGLIAIGESYGSDFSGAYLVSQGARSGPIGRRAQAVVKFVYRQIGGAYTGFAAVGADDTEWFVVGASGQLGPAPLPGEVVAIQADAEGEFDSTTVPLRLIGEPGFGEAVAAWDPDGDGQLDLVAAAPSGVYFFQGPWIGHGTDADRTGSWDERGGGPFPDAGSVIEVVGDVTGDGADDLAFSSPDWGEDPFRVGHAYLVPGGGDLRFGWVEDLPIQFHGVVEGEGMGWGLHGADVSGDGSADLVVGASGVFPGDVPGSVLLFQGPVAAGSYDAADATAAVHGEYIYDLFGRAIASVDADGDAAADLVVGAHQWPGGYSQGKVYLLPGAALMP